MTLPLTRDALAAALFTQIGHVGMHYGTENARLVNRHHARSAIEAADVFMAELSKDGGEAPLRAELLRELPSWLRAMANWDDGGEAALARMQDLLIRLTAEG